MRKKIVSFQKCEICNRREFLAGKTTRVKIFILKAPHFFLYNPPQSIASSIVKRFVLTKICLYSPIIFKLSEEIFWLKLRKKGKCLDSRISFWDSVTTFLENDCTKSCYLRLATRLGLFDLYSIAGFYMLPVLRTSKLIWIGTYWYECVVSCFL